MLCKAFAQGMALELSTIYLGGNRVSSSGMALSQVIRVTRVTHVTHGGTRGIHGTRDIRYLCIELRHVSSSGFALAHVVLVA